MNNLPRNTHANWNYHARNSEREPGMWGASQLIVRTSPLPYDAQTAAVEATPVKDGEGARRGQPPTEPLEPRRGYRPLPSLGPWGACYLTPLRRRRRAKSSRPLAAPSRPRLALGGADEHRVEMQLFLKSHYRHRTGIIIPGINTGVPEAFRSVYLVNTGNVPAARRYYRLAGNVVGNVILHH